MTCNDDDDDDDCDGGVEDGEAMVMAVPRYLPIWLA